MLCLVEQSPWPQALSACPYARCIALMLRPLSWGQGALCPVVSVTGGLSWQPHGEVFLPSFNCLPRRELGRGAGWTGFTTFVYEGERAFTHHEPGGVERALQWHGFWFSISESGGPTCPTTSIRGAEEGVRSPPAPAVSASTICRPVSACVLTSVVVLFFPPQS